MRTRRSRANGASAKEPAHRLRVCSCDRSLLTHLGLPIRAPPATPPFAPMPSLFADRDDRGGYDDRGDDDGIAFHGFSMSWRNTTSSRSESENGSGRSATKRSYSTLARFITSDT